MAKTQTPEEKAAQDAAAEQARIDEAASDDAVVEWRGLRLVIPTGWRDWSYDAVQGMTHGNVIQAVDGFMDDQEVATRNAYRNLKPRGADTEELYEQILTALGFRNPGD